MIQIDNVEVFGWEAAFRGMRNAKNSWDRADSRFVYENIRDSIGEFVIGPNDLKLATSLRKGGPEHRKFMRMIHVQFDLTAPFYFWKEFDTYKVGTVANSCSTMHKLTSRPIEVADFSCDSFEELEGIPSDMHLIEEHAKTCEELRNKHLHYVEAAKREDITEAERKHFQRCAKVYWRRLIQMLGTSYNQKRTIDLNYEVLFNQRHQRNGHKLTEWHSYCDFIDSLPNFKEICLDSAN